jgi:hypothetical protein
MNQAIDHYDNDISPAHIYNIDILEAICLAEIAWKEVDTTMICNCRQKTEILPDTLFNPMLSTTPTVPVSFLLNNNLKDSIQTAEKEVVNSLFHLERIWVLQPRNQMDLNELLNPVNEHNMYDNGTEEEIHQVVMEQREAE